MLDPRIILLQGLLMEHNLIITSITVYITLLRIQFYSNPKPHKRSHRNQPRKVQKYLKKNAFCQKKISKYSGKFSKIFIARSRDFPNFYNKVKTVIFQDFHIWVEYREFRIFSYLG